MNDDTKQHSSPIDFPCEFSVKVMGKATAAFEKKVAEIMLRHFPTADLKNAKKKPSKDNTYLALTISVHADSKTQLDALYQELSDTPEILVAL